MALAHLSTEKRWMRGAPSHCGQPSRQAAAGDHGSAGGTCGGWPRRFLKNAARPLDAAGTLRPWSGRQWRRRKSGGVDTKLPHVDLLIARGSQPRSPLGAGRAFRRRAGRSARWGGQGSRAPGARWPFRPRISAPSDSAVVFAVVACQRDFQRTGRLQSTLKRLHSWQS